MLQNIKEIPKDPLPDLQDGKIHLLFVDDGESNRANFKMGVIRRLKDVSDKVQITIFDISDEMNDFLQAQDDLSKVVVATDKDMPNTMSGIDLAVALKAKDANLPIVIWTGEPKEAEDDPRRPADVPVYDKPRIIEMFDQFIRSHILSRLQGPTLPAVDPRSLPQDKPEPGKA